MSDQDDPLEWSDCDDDEVEEEVMENELDDNQENEFDLLENWMNVDECLNGLHEMEDLLSVPLFPKSTNKFTSLKEICLECISSSIERFNNAYLVSENPMLRRHLNFLQRVYTPNLIGSLIEKKAYNDKYLEFLMNEHMKEVDIGEFIVRKESLKAIEERITLIGHSFKKVSLKKTRFDITDQDIPDFLCAVIPHLPNVEELKINFHCNDTVLEKISLYCTELTVLNVDYSPKVTEIGLEKLCKNYEKLPKECALKKLSMKVVGLTDAIVTTILKSMPNLEVLGYKNVPRLLYEMHKADLENNTLENVRKYNLTELDFSNDYNLYGDNTFREFSEILQICNVLCPNTNTLEVCLPAKANLDQISCFKNLENLSIQCLHSEFVELDDFLKSCYNLLSLQINHFAISVSVLKERCPKLKSLFFDNVSFKTPKKIVANKQCFDRDFKNLNELFLKNLVFTDNYAEESVTNILLASPNLENLSFHSCKFEFENSEVNAKLLKYFEKCKIECLTFNDCNIELPFLESIILTCPTLASLTIDSCENITYDDVAHLEFLKNSSNNFVEIVYNAEDESNVYTDDDLYYFYDGEDESFGFDEDSDYDYDADYDYEDDDYYDLYDD